jgi:hypothetical protein
MDFASESPYLEEHPAETFGRGQRGKPLSAVTTWLVCWGMKGEFLYANAGFSEVFYGLNPNRISENVFFQYFNIS